MKPITLCIASAEGLISPSEVFPCPGYRMLDGKRIGCEAHRSSTPAPGTNTPRMVIAKSCNTATSLIANRIGGTRLGAGMERFGLLAPTGVQLLGDRAGWLEARKPASDQSRGAVARIGFGQSVMISPLALTAAFGAIVNRGVLMRPRIVQALTDQANRVIQEFPVEEAGRAVPREVADTMVTYLQAAVTEGTGKLARLDGFTTGGKTGTASKVKGDTYSEHVASFIGYVQAGERRIVIAVVVDEPKNGYHGGQAAAPTFRRIAKELVLHWHVAPDKSGPPTKVARADGGMPND
jgi:cell division protein FtsI/penicillin-binding protein 2